jgi:hypothetical protein
LLPISEDSIVFSLPDNPVNRLLLVAVLMGFSFLAAGAAASRFGTSLIPRFLARTRYAWLFGLALVALPLGGTIGLPTMMYALFVLDGPGQFASVTCLSFMLATLVYSTVRLAFENGDARFGPLGISEVSERRWRTIRLMIVPVLGMIVPIVSGVATYRDQIEPTPWTLVWIICGIVAGIVATWALWYTLAFLEHVLVPPALISPGLFPTSGIIRLASKPRLPSEMFWNTLARMLGPKAYGYTHTVDGQLTLRPGHAQMMLFWLLLAVLYIVRYIDAGALRLALDETTAFPVLFHVLTICLLVGITLTGASFFLDYYRVPVLWLMLLAMLLSNIAFDDDHFYELRMGDHKSTVPEFITTYDHWKFPRGKDGKRNLIIVTCSGGGIQASAWAAKVLTELGTTYRGFHDSIGAISGVSGGSVATMYYTMYSPKRDNSGGRGKNLLPTKIAQAIFDDASRSNLEAAAWGMAFPDFLRSVCPPLVPAEVDRGWALEQLWEARLKRRGVVKDGEPPTLRSLSDRVRRGELAPPFFNATIVETGQRLLMGATSGPAGKGKFQEHPWDLFSLYPNADPRITTAVRLSATFSYVSPICRPLELPSVVDPTQESDIGQPFHVADGGYTDNEGIMTAMSAIMTAAQMYSGENR